ncbi:MAG: hypothetical protein ABI036_04455, partial [Fibrobacteria bacterium]
MSRPSSPFVPLAICAAFALAAVSNTAAAFKYWNVADTSKVPATLTATGAFTSVATGKLIPEAHPYEVNSPLWSDDAHKTRWILLPPGKSVVFSEKNDYWVYPDSAVFIKEFDIDTIPGDSTSRRRWETRFLINKREVIDTATMQKSDHWYGFTYRWNATGTEGTYVGKYSVNDSIRVYPKGRGTAAKMKKWTFPAEQCSQCHSSAMNDTTHARSVLGFFTAQLNRPMLGKPGVNQLDSLFKLNVLTGTKPASWANSPRWRAIDDSTASVNVRARSYLASNCSGCHGERANANAIAGQCRWLADYHVMNDSLYDFRHQYSRPFNGMDTLLPQFYPVTDKGNNPRGYNALVVGAELIVPGYPLKSAIIQRQIARDTFPGFYDPLPDQMPPVGTFEANMPAIALLSKWVEAYPATPAQGWDDSLNSNVGIHARANPAGAGLVFKGDRILVLPENTKAGTRVTMSSLDGKNIP